MVKFNQERLTREEGKCNQGKHKSGDTLNYNGMPGCGNKFFRRVRMTVMIIEFLSLNNLQSKTSVLISLTKKNIDDQARSIQRRTLIKKVPKSVNELENGIYKTNKAICFFRYRVLTNSLFQLA
jgi:hypothetical protein